MPLLTCFKTIPTYAILRTRRSSTILLATPDAKVNVQFRTYNFHFTMGQRMVMLAHIGYGK